MDAPRISYVSSLSNITRCCQTRRWLTPCPGSARSGATCGEGAVCRVAGPGHQRQSALAASLHLIIRDDPWMAYALFPEH
eukprot:scaffold158120_cov41-Tisochrysis_lutea.AAC.3